MPKPESSRRYPYSQQDAEHRAVARDLGCVCWNLPAGVHHPRCPLYSSPAADVDPRTDSDGASPVSSEMKGETESGGVTAREGLDSPPDAGVWEREEQHAEERRRERR